VSAAWKSRLPTGGLQADQPAQKHPTTDASIADSMWKSPKSGTHISPMPIRIGVTALAERCVFITIGNVKDLVYTATQPDKQFQYKPVLRVKYTGYLYSPKKYSSR